MNTTHFTHGSPSTWEVRAFQDPFFPRGAGHRLYLGTNDTMARRIMEVFLTGLRTWKAHYCVALYKDGKEVSTTQR